jgi:hypothetical protein
MVEFSSFIIQFFSLEPFICKLIQWVINCELGAVSQTKVLPVVWGVMVSVDLRTSSKQVVKYDVILGDDATSASVKHTRPSLECCPLISRNMPWWDWFSHRGSFPLHFQIHHVNWTTPYMIIEKPVTRNCGPREDVSWTDPIVRRVFVYA